MPRQPTKTILNPQTFAPSILAHSEGLGAAFRMLESCLADPDVPLELIVQDLCSVPNLFGFIVSAWPRAHSLVRRIMDAYPANPAHVETSCACTLLRRLADDMFALPPVLFPTDVVRHIGRYKIYLEDALPALKLLCSTDLSVCCTIDSTPEIPLEEPDYEDDELSGIPMRSKKQKKSRSKNKNNLPVVDTAPFHKLGAKTPVNNVEASQMASEITDELKRILNFHLKLLLEPFLANGLRDVYIATPGNDTTICGASVPQEINVIEAVEPRPSAYPNIQPMKAALYFENADGFGEWRIIIGTDATRKLRHLANGDKEKCRIVVKKIKQLSRGHFSDENQKRLNGSSGIPIFEAKMQRDLRLVYQIDVVPDHDGQADRQVIKIYGIYTHAQLGRIWSAMGQHLTRKGKEYRRRCMFRNRPVHGGDVYLPATFPPESLQDDLELTPFVLSDKDMGELHSLLVLEKYVIFSQAFLHSLIINQDVQHVFELTLQERRIVECMTSCYVLGRSGTGKTTTMLFKMLGIQRAWELMPDMPRPRQIFVTKSCVLASKVQEYFARLLEFLALAGYSVDDLKRLKAQSTGSHLDGNDGRGQVDIPQRYSALQEKHFPLFVTFDKLVEMIGMDVLGGDDPEAQGAAKYFIDSNEIEARDSFVTYDVFVQTYWPHFPQPLTKGLEPWLVFSEFMGIIKGSEKSLSCPGGFLDEKAYCALSARSNPTFANQRQLLYGIFEAYCKLKRERRHHDVADRTHMILKALLGGTPLKGQRVDYLYVDEAQDNLLIDALLLRLICKNPEGLFWAGDTAQTISAGSSFRFDDLKAFLYRIEKDQRTHLIQERSIRDPTTFQLAINYRSHGGIINCAHSVIERITFFWPDTIDSLQPEHGIVDGLKPVFFRGWDQDTVRYEQFLFGESGNRIEFGAEQCILVRDNKAAEKLREEIGEEVGLIMALYDSKGLEFNDVLLYNFFEDSSIDAARWRILLSHAHGEVDGQDLAKIHAPSFERDGAHFAGVCSELKLLYVGITRARKNLWIFDKSDKSDPMRMIWTARNQVQNCTPGTDVPHLAVSSTPAEWESFGRSLFEHKRYPQAMHCFARASIPHMVAVCEAFQLREVARNKLGVTPREVEAQREAFHAAADALMKVAQDAPAGRDKLQYYRIGAECYVRTKNYRKAATGYLSAQDYDNAARNLRRAGLFDETVEVLHEYSHKISAECSKELYTVCQLFYCKKNDGSRPRWPLFPSFEEELEFLELYDLDFARASLLESHRRYLEAAHLHLAENRPLDAIRDFLKEESRGAIQQATEIILDGLWRQCSFGIPSEKVAMNKDVGELLRLAHELPLDFLDPLDYNEISMFRAITEANEASLEKLSRIFIEGGRHMAALLALDHFFNRLPVLESHSLLEMSQFLDKFRDYIRLLHCIISHPDPLGDRSIRRLFGIEEMFNTEYGVAPDSFLHSLVTRARHGPLHRQPSVIILSKREIVVELRKYLTRHLCNRVTEENKMCYEAVVFSQCLLFIVNGYCNYANCTQEHVKSAELDSKRYNVRIGVHLQQIHILQLMYSVNPRPDRLNSILEWLTYLYEAFNPQLHVQGSIADLDLSVIHDSRESLGVVKHWVQDALYALRANRDPPNFLTTVLKLTSLLFTFDKSSAIKCVSQAQFNAPHARVQAFLYPDGYYVLEDIVNLFDGTKQSCISSGLKFLKHVVASKLFVDLSVFCDCLEEVISKICVSWRLSYNPPLDGLVLPRSWLSSNKDFSRRKDTSIVLIVHILEYIRELMERLQSDTASQFYSLSNTKLTPMLRNVFISRICRALCLLTYNVRNTDVKRKVKGIFGALQATGPTQKAHYLYRKYAYARENEYLKAVTQYDVEREVVIPDLVQLLHKKRDPTRAPPLRLPRIEHINFTDPSEIPSLLASQLVVARSELHADALAFVPQGGLISHAEKAEDEQKIQLEEPQVELVDEIYEEPQELVPVPDEPALICEHEPTEEEISAAMTIQATYRMYRKHCEAQARTFGKGLVAKRNTLFAACLRNVQAYGWGKTTYRDLYLGALPRLVVCLDRAISIAHEHKGRIKDLFLKESHARLEELGKQTSRINALLKDGHNLRKRIDPSAPMHQVKNKDAMIKAVTDVEEFIRSLPSPAPEVKGDLDVVYKLVMVEKQKPTLNTEDL